MCREGVSTEYTALDRSGKFGAGNRCKFGAASCQIRLISNYLFVLFYHIDIFLNSTNDLKCLGRRRVSCSGFRISHGTTAVSKQLNR